MGARCSIFDLVGVLWFCSLMNIWTMSYEYSSGSKPFFEVGFFIIIRSSECDSLRSGIYA